MLVAETDPVQQSFDPWTVVADANGEFDTSWYVFSEDFIGATFLATATGQSSQLTASATFTDASYQTYENAPPNPASTPTIQRDAFAWGATVHYAASGVSGRCHKIEWVNPAGTPDQTNLIAGNPTKHSLVIPASSG